MPRLTPLEVEALDLSPRRCASSAVTLPLAAPGILAGAILCFARSVGEFGATITFVSNIPGETRTLPMAIYSLTDTPGGDAAAFAADRHLGRARDVEIAVERSLDAFRLASGIERECEED